MASPKDLKKAPEVGFQEGAGMSILEQGRLTNHTAGKRLRLKAIQRTQTTEQECVMFGHKHTFPKQPQQRTEAIDRTLGGNYALADSHMGLLAALLACW